MTIKDLQPKAVWENFYGLTRVPRPSKHEEKVREYLLNWGKEHGIDVRKDDTGNVIFTVPATPGFEFRRRPPRQSTISSPTLSRPRLKGSG